MKLSRVTNKGTFQKYIASGSDFPENKAKRGSLRNFEGGCILLQLGYLFLSRLNFVIHLSVSSFIWLSTIKLAITFHLPHHSDSLRPSPPNFGHVQAASSGFSVQTVIALAVDFHKISRRFTKPKKQHLASTCSIPLAEQP